MKEEKPIAISVIKRLPIYYRVLTKLEQKNIETISSGKLAEKLNTTASQIRQDLNQFGSFGHKGFGYQVSSLKKEIGRILGLEKQKDMILVGAGNLGKAIVNYPNFKRRGFNIKAVFDVDPIIVGQEVNGIIIKDVKLLKDFLENNEIDIAIITTPAESAEKFVDIFVEGRVKAIWNFAPISLNCSDRILVENVHISESLLTLSYMIDKKFN